MIEMIFVIVIIGILAAVAIPKLAATRDDAQVVALAQRVTTAAWEISAHTLAQGELDESRLAESSKALSMMLARGEAADDRNGTVRIRMGRTTDCLILRIVRGGGDANLTLSYGSAGADAKCRALQRMIRIDDYPMPLTGARVSY